MSIENKKLPEQNESREIYDLVHKINEDNILIKDRLYKIENNINGRLNILQNDIDKIIIFILCCIIIYF